MVLSLILSLGLVASATALAIPQPLRFTKEGTFQLSVFSDLHYGEGRIISISFYSFPFSSFPSFFYAAN